MTDSQDDWLVTHFRIVADDFMRLRTLAQLSISGITALTEMPRIGEAIEQLLCDRGTYQPSDILERTQAEAELAKFEVDQGFPITLSQYLGTCGVFSRRTLRTLLHCGSSTKMECSLLLF